MDYTALKTYILAEPAYAQWIEDGIDTLIAKDINTHTTEAYKATEVGVGTILETIGIASGNALLDAIKNTPDFRHVWPLIEQGRLRLDSPVTLGALDVLVGAGVITAAEGAALKAVAKEDKPLFGQTIHHLDVAKALRG